MLLVSNLFPPDIGGPATYVSRLSHDLHRRGHSVQLVVCAEDPAAGGKYPFPVRRVSRQTFMPLRMLIVLLWVIWHARRADVVYVNGLELPGVLGSRLMRKPAALKVVGDFAWEYAVRHGWTDDGIDHFQSARYGWKVELVRRVEHWYAQHVGRVITPSLYLKSIVSGWGVPPQRISVVYNALTSRFDGKTTQEEARRAVGLEGTLVLTVARLYKWKNIDVLIRLVPDLPSESKLVIVGDGPEEAFLRGLAAELGVDDRVVFVGRVPQSQVALYLRAADVFVLNTRYEGLSHTILECMDVGLPVVATAVGGNVAHQLIEDGVNGFLVPVDDRTQIVSAVRKLLHDKEVRDGFVERSKEKVKDSSWDRLVDTVVATLDQVARRG
ncbi:MAG: glycosyltransferase family 4 protein [Chloroflexi bacterium]|nr:glycosyltransferase family 4 protein [Chloroflexota bacterium]